MGCRVVSAWRNHDMAGEQAIVWDGCDEAIVGVGTRCGHDGLFVYDYDLLVELFMAQQMSKEEAMEWVDYNIVGAWVGEGTPIVLYRG